MAIMCKDCCEVSEETGLYENCPFCGSHRIWDIDETIESEPEASMNDYVSNVSYFCG